MKDVDFVQYVIQRARELGADIDDDLARRLEADIRHMYGGDFPYVRQKSENKHDAQRENVLRARQSGATVREMESKFGLSRGSIYRILKGEAVSNSPESETD